MKKPLMIGVLLLAAAGGLKAQDLFSAIRDRDVPGVKFLCEKGADLKKKNVDGDTPLLVAVRNGEDRIVRLLLQYQVAVDERDKLGNTPLILASRAGRSEIVSRLLCHFPKLGLKNKAGETAMTAARVSDDSVTIEALEVAGGRLAVR